MGPVPDDPPEVVKIQETDGMVRSGGRQGLRGRSIGRKSCLADLLLTWLGRLCRRHLSLPKEDDTKLGAGSTPQTSPDEPVGKEGMRSRQQESDPLSCVLRAFSQQTLRLLMRNPNVRTICGGLSACAWQLVSYQGIQARRRGETTTWGRLLAGQAYSGIGDCLSRLCFDLNCGRPQPSQLPKITGTSRDSESISFAQ